jgi:hypothetical protein
MDGVSDCRDCRGLGGVCACGRPALNFPNALCAKCEAEIEDDKDLTAILVSILTPPTAAQRAYLEGR